jgi:uncharacterized phage infection (PIP) family protein YhgE
MSFKDFLAKTKSKTGIWLQGHKGSDYQPQIDEDGLINPEPDAANSNGIETDEQHRKVVVKAVAARGKTESLDKLQEGFGQLVEQLQGINNHLNQQVSQHQELMGRIEQLPKLLENFPKVVEGQKQITEHLFEQLKSAAAKNDQFLDAVEKIPNETAKQTDALVNIDHQLAAAADTDVQRAESFNKFNETLAKLNKSTLGQTDSISHMSKTFATSDRYLKYLISRQNRRFMWIFITAIGVCVGAILVLAGIIIYLANR